jgi:hypothetical protein
MASTRNKNTPINYKQQMAQYAHNMQYNLYKNSQAGEAYKTDLAGVGLLQGHMPASKLSHNPVEIESFLFGINSTNLVNPQGPITAELKDVPFANMYKPEPTVMPEPLVVQRNRPFPIP